MLWTRLPNTTIIRHDDSSVNGYSTQYIKLRPFQAYVRNSLLLQPVWLQPTRTTILISRRRPVHFRFRAFPLPTKLYVQSLNLLVYASVDIIKCFFLKCPLSWKNIYTFPPSYPPTDSLISTVCIRLQHGYKLKVLLPFLFFHLFVLGFVFLLFLIQM